MAGSRLIQAHPRLTRPTRLESNRLPNPYAIMNNRINGMGPEQYPPSPALVRNEIPPYPRLFGTDYQKSIFKVESQETRYIVLHQRLTTQSETRM